MDETAPAVKAGLGAEGQGIGNRTANGILELTGNRVRPGLGDWLRDIDGDEGTLMPIYEFHCESCDRDFEELLPTFKDVQKVACPACRSGQVIRRPSVFSSHQPKTCPTAEMSSGACNQCRALGGGCGLDG
jgi:putative FmdB family regulatory protein